MTLFYKISGIIGRIPAQLYKSKIRQAYGIDLTKVHITGRPWIRQAEGSRIAIGDSTHLVSKFEYNVAGINHPCIVATTRKNATIRIGSDGGFSGVTIVAAKAILIGDRVSCGVNVCIYDNDFHPLNAHLRTVNNESEIAALPVTIGNDIWIGANSLILKGVIIGDRSIVGAGSVVTTDIPADSIYAGNPARFIKRIEEHSLAAHLGQ